jgi:hypothetical protein
MGDINRINGDKKTKSTPNKYMVSVTFDLWAETHRDASHKLADYLKKSLFNPMSQKTYFEATQLGKGNETMDNGIDILL